MRQNQFNKPSDGKHDSGLRRFLAGFQADRDCSLFLIVGIFYGIATGIYSTIFNNYLSDVYHLSADSRGIVEFPRELPGAFIMVVLAFLAFLGNVRIAVIGTLAAAAGMIGMGLFSPTFAVMLIWLMVFSLGIHMVLPVTPAIGMDLSKTEDFGSRLARYSAYNLSGTILAYAFVWLGFRYLGLTYETAFVIAAVFYVMTAVSAGLLKPGKPEKRKVKFIFRKRYTLYYILCIVNGARKQIFMTFAPWVLIQVFGLDAPVFAILGVIVAAVSIMTGRSSAGRSTCAASGLFCPRKQVVLLLSVSVMPLRRTFSGQASPS
jgi:MFS family permease